MHALNVLKLVFAAVAMSFLPGAGHAESIEKVIPLHSECLGDAMNWNAKMGLNQTFVVQVQPVQDSAGGYRFELFQPLMGRDLEALPAAPPEAAPHIAAATNGWLVIQLYNSGETALDPDTSDYQVQVFLQEGDVTAPSCYAVYPDGIHTPPEVVAHDGLAPLVGNITASE